MGKISVSIDASKAKQLISTRTYKNREGKDVTVKEIKFDLVELKNDKKKVLVDKESYELVKTHFAVKQQTKEERAAKVDPVFVGDGITINFKDDGGAPASAPVATEEEDDLPF